MAVLLSFCNFLTFFAVSFHLFTYPMVSSYSFQMSLSRETVLKPFIQGNALKVISGINKFDKGLVSNVASAAAIGGASHIDIACDPELVRVARQSAGNAIAICVSSVVPEKFVEAVHAGADMIEIGNYDFLYDEGIIYTAEDVVKMTMDTRKLLPNVVLSVTIPHTLSLSDQVALAKKLEDCGADIIQTEGKMSVHSTVLGVQELIERAAPTLASAYALSRAVKIPVMCASGVTDVTAKMALAAGARGVGIGSMVNKLSDVNQMIMAVTAVADAMGREKVIMSTNANIPSLSKNIFVTVKSAAPARPSEN